MLTYRVVSDQGPTALEREDVPAPQPGPNEVVVDLKAASLNYRDLIVTRGGYLRNDRRPVVPLSDGAGVIAAVGSDVHHWAAGDRVAANFMADWISGPVTETALNSSLGGGRDGVLAEQFVVPADSLVPIPDHLDFAEAATLPCAAVTAWNALTSAGTTAGDTVLLLGTGGVSMFGIQLAKCLGAVPLVTSSSDEKLARAKQLGAAQGINYRKHPDWDQQVLHVTDGRGVDHVLETGGPGTLERSMAAVAVGGTISLIGVLADGDPPPMTLAMLKAVTVRGIYVGSNAMFASLCRAVATHQLRPVIDSRFPFEAAIDAYLAFEKQQHTGKIVIEVT